jgi:AcrR family transcriptional regulator
MATTRPKRSIDLRVARTRATLHDALLALIPDKGYEAITVSDICERAKIARSTFYMHYTGKDDLMRSGFKNLHDLVGNSQMLASTQRNPMKCNLAFSRAIFEHARGHAHLHRTLIGSRGGTIAIDMIRQVLCEVVRRQLFAAGTKPKDAVHRELVVNYMVGAFMGVVAWWLDGGAELPIERIDDMFRHLASEGMASLN